MKKGLYLLLAVLISVSTGYSQSKKKIRRAMDSWLGSTKHELIVGLGPASRSVSDGNGGEILIYSRVNEVNRDVWRVTSDGMLYNEQRMPDVYYRHRMFYLGTDNKVYHWRIESNKIPPERLMIGGSVDLNIYSH